MSEIDLRDAVFIPPPGCALNGMTRHKNELRLLLIAPAAGGGYWVSGGEPGSAPELIKWTGTATAVAPDLLSRLVARVSDADWSAATWTARPCAPARENPVLSDVESEPLSEGRIRK